MTDPLQDVLAPAAIERALEIYRQMRECDHTELVQARKCATEQVFAMIDGGERDEQQLVIGVLTHLKAQERARAAKPAAKPTFANKSERPAPGGKTAARATADAKA
jgi:hypothetical protein